MAKKSTTLALAEAPDSVAVSRKLKAEDLINAGYIPFPITITDKSGEKVVDTLYFKQPRLSHKMTLANSKIKGGEIDFEYLISLLPSYVVTEDGKPFFSSADEVESVGDLQLGARLVKKLLNLMMGQDTDDEDEEGEGADSTNGDQKKKETTTHTPLEPVSLTDPT